MFGHMSSCLLGRQLCRQCQTMCKSDYVQICISYSLQCRFWVINICEVPWRRCHGDGSALWCVTSTFTLCYVLLGLSFIAPSSHRVSSSSSSSPTIATTIIISLIIIITGLFISKRDSWQPRSATTGSALVPSCVPCWDLSIPYRAFRCLINYNAYLSHLSQLVWKSVGKNENHLTLASCETGNLTVHCNPHLSTCH